MLLIGSYLLEAFAKRHPTSRKRFEHWIRVVKVSRWKHLEDVKKTYQQTDGGIKRIYTVFNQGDFRVIARVDFEASVVAVTHVLTHDEYDHWSKKK